MPDEFFSFERVLKELHMEEEELKRLISEGEIRAFRDEDRMKFKKEDIEALKKKRVPGRKSSKEETIDVIEELETLDEGEDSIPTVEFGGKGEDETLTEELIFEEGGTEAGMATEQIPEASLLEEAEEEVASMEPQTAGRPTRGVRTAPARTKPRGRRDEDEGKTEGALWLTLIIASSVVLFYSIFMTYSATHNRPTGVTEWFMKFTHDTFMGGKKA